MDWLRGAAIVLMGLDHALAAFAPQHLVTDSAAIWQPGSVLPAGPFLARWITHFCAPIFVLLAGASLCFVRARHDAFGLRRATERGCFLTLLDPLVLTWLWMHIEPLPRPWLLQVIFAIGVSMVLCVGALIWIPSIWRTLAAALYLLFQDAIVWASLGGDLDRVPTGLTALLITGGMSEHWVAIYPVLPWCCVMLLGLRLGEEWLRFATNPAALDRRLRNLGVGLVLLFLLVRGFNGFGNLGLYRDDAHWLQWLHCSKYPPALSFLAMTVGPTCLLLSWLRKRERNGEALPGASVLITLGRAALCFYVAHLAILAALRILLPLEWRNQWFAWGIALVLPFLLLPPLRRYLELRQAHPDGWLRWL